MAQLLTDRLLRGLKPAAAGKRTALWDSAVPSLCVRVTDKGSASFSVMRRLRGKVVRRMIGVVPGIDPWRFHDLRRTMRTGLSALRIADAVSELCIAHTQKGLHKVYDQHSYLDEKRRPFELWADRLLSIVEPGDGNVVRLKARR